MRLPYHPRQHAGTQGKVNASFSGSPRRLDFGGGARRCEGFAEVLDGNPRAGESVAWAAVWTSLSDAAVSDLACVAASSSDEASAGGGAASVPAGTADATLVFNYAGRVNGSTKTGLIADALPSTAPAAIRRRTN